MINNEGSRGGGNDVWMVAMRIGLERESQRSVAAFDTMLIDLGRAEATPGWAHSSRPLPDMRPCHETSPGEAHSADDDGDRRGRGLAIDAGRLGLRARGIAQRLLWPGRYARNDEPGEGGA